MEKFEFVDSKKDQVTQEVLHLSVQVSHQSFSFAIQQADDSRLLYLRHIPFERIESISELARKLREAIQSDNNLPGNCKEVKAIWVSPKYTLVPESYYEQSFTRKLYELAHPLDELDELHTYALTGMGYQVIYAIPQEIAHELYQVWPEVEFYSQLVPFVQLIEHDQEKHPGTGIYNQAYPDFTDVVVLAENKLKLANPYPVKEMNDWLYGIMNIMKQSGLDHPHTELGTGDHFLEGLSDPDALRKYFGKLRYLKPGIPQYNISFFDSKDVNRFVNLLGIINCA